MNHETNHNQNPLPEMDAHLSRLLSSDGAVVPDGLTDRVFNASRGRLPAPAPLAQLHGAAEAELEARLTEILADQPIPTGLTDRVYAASAPALPSRMRFAEPAAQPRRVFGGRLAMAASVALVACVGVWFAKMPGSTGIIGNGNPDVAMRDDATAGLGDGTSAPAGDGVNARLASSVTMPTDADWRLLDTVDHGHNEVRYLLESSELSLQALAAEMDAMVDRPGG